MSVSLSHDVLAYEPGQLPQHLRSLTDSDIESASHLHQRRENWWDLFLYDQYDWDGFKASYAVIRLNRGYFMMVDKRSYKRFAKYNWTVDFQYDGSPERRVIAVYAVRSVRTEKGKSKKEYAHRFAVRAAPSEIVDHGNQYGLDNRLRNLAIASHSQNGANASNWTSRKAYPGLPPLPRGVHPLFLASGTKFRSQIMVYGKNHNSPAFPTIEQAHRWYLRMHKNLFPKRPLGWLTAERQEPIFPPLKADGMSSSATSIAARAFDDIPF